MIVVVVLVVVVVIVVRHAVACPDCAGKFVKKCSKHGKKVLEQYANF